MFQLCKDCRDEFIFWRGEFGSQCFQVQTVGSKGKWRCGWGGINTGVDTFSLIWNNAAHPLTSSFLLHAQKEAFDPIFLGPLNVTNWTALLDSCYSAFVLYFRCICLLYMMKLSWDSENTGWIELVSLLMSLMFLLRTQLLFKRWMVLGEEVPTLSC